MYKQITSNIRKSILLISLFILVILALGWFLGYLTGYGLTGLIIAIIIATFLTLLSYYAGDKVALRIAGAQPIAKKDNPYIYRLVENLCITAGLSLPKIYLIPDEAPNAFATGRNPAHASIALTTGLIERLEKVELEGVIAHELAHIKNYDIRLATLVILCIGIISLLSHFLLRTAFYGTGRRRSREGNLAIILLVVGLVSAILAPIIGRLIQFAISRKREFLADASGAMLTRFPEGLARALEKIKSYTRPVRRVNPSTAHLYISNPFGKTKGLVARLFSTHPPIEERIKALRKMIR
jgi:heat shock protein HtpX